MRPNRRITIRRLSRESASNEHPTMQKSQTLWEFSYLRENLTNEIAVHWLSSTTTLPLAHFYDAWMHSSRILERAFLPPQEGLWSWRSYPVDQLWKRERSRQKCALRNSAKKGNKVLQQCFPYAAAKWIHNIINDAKPRFRSWTAEIQGKRAQYFCSFSQLRRSWTLLT